MTAVAERRPDKQAPNALDTAPLMPEGELPSARPDESPRAFVGLPGDVLAGKYRIERMLGRGGMGVVAEATDTSLQRRVAIKFLLPEKTDDKAAIARFLREARAAAKIRSEHVAHVYEVGEMPSGAPYIVMEFLEGEDLATVLNEKGALSVRDAAGYVLEACEALAEAHRAQVVHRDLKPSNFFLGKKADDSRVIKVLDFGISKHVGGTQLTSSQVVMGTPAYMSPEQVEGSADIDWRTDIWSLGVVLYQLVTGRLPFKAENLTATCLLIVRGRYARLSEHVPGMDPSFEAVVDRCLELAPSDRFQSAGDLASALEPFAPDHTKLAAERARRLSVPGEPREAASHGAPQASQKTTTAYPRKRDPEAHADHTASAWEEEHPEGRTLGPRRKLGLAALGLAASVALAAYLSAPKRQIVPEGAAASNPVTDSAPAPASPSPGTEGEAEQAPSLPSSSPRVATSATAPGTAPSPSLVPAAAKQPSLTQRVPGSKPPKAPADPAPSAAPRCRVLNVSEGGAALERTSRNKITFALARESCLKKPHAPGRPYHVAERGIDVGCICE